MAAVVRKLMFLKEQAERRLETDLICWTRSAVIVVLKNQWVDESETAIFNAAEMAEELVARLAPQVVSSLGGPVTTYGKGILLGSDVSEVLAAAIIHKGVGKPIRAAVGGGAAVIPSNMKRGSMGAAIDVPLGHKDDPWKFLFAETLSIAVPDAPSSDEFVLCVAVGGENPNLSLSENKDVGAAQ